MPLLRMHLSKFYLRRHAAKLLFTVIAALLLVSWLQSAHPSFHAVIPGAPVFEDLNVEDLQLVAAKATALCKAHGFSAYRKPGRKVYDLVLLSTELDWLEIRLNELAPYVDYFVIVESPTTFTGKPKPLYLKEKWEQFSQFHDKIIHRVVEDPIDSQRLWDHEAFLRNSLLHEVFPTLTGLPSEAKKGDVLIVSDMDELIRPETATVLRHCDFPPRLTLRSQFFYFSYEWQHRGEEWSHPQATVYEGNVKRTISPEELRMNLLGPGWTPLAAIRRIRDQATLWNAGWHCSSCFATITEVQAKMNGFSHQSLNTPDNRNPQNIINRFRSGVDPFGREEEIYDRIPGNTDVPNYVLEQNRDKGKFQYLLNRSGPYGAFTDARSALRQRYPF